MDDVPLRGSDRARGGDEQAAGEIGTRRGGVRYAGGGWFGRGAGLSLVALGTAFALWPLFALKPSRSRVASPGPARRSGRSRRSERRLLLPPRRTG
ncbi:hypothetical protein SGL43_04124 [Streptomyces globisporus]|uniref:Uncharacterized protein n=1 Tax=Streptomyces globisporus TaxID=1908 RepID=A0ABN8V3G9_STRGL|nr:hypothetical protein SGL43_04124 [Streptomyces globisporus]